MSDRPSPRYDNPQEAPQEASVQLTQFPIKDKEGKDYSVDYYTFPKDFLAMNDPRVGNHFFDAMRIARQVFPYGDRAMDRLVRKFNTAQAIDIIRSVQSKVVGFHVYNFDEIAVGDSKAKVLFTEYAAVRPELQGKGLTTQARIPVIEKEKPDILCGTTGNPAVYLMNSSVASEMGYILYPKEDTTPAKISALAHTLGDRFGITDEGRLDDRLVITYPENASRGKMEHPLFDTNLQMGENQHILYLALKSSLNDALVKVS